MIFAGKAAPGYAMAKAIVKLINNVARTIDSDESVRDKLRVAFLPDYDISLAQKIMPAADLSQQISTAGMEASGTGNMKLALNGALTIGTLDGANIEICDHVGAENMFIFGLTADEVAAQRAAGYRPRTRARAAMPELKRTLDLIGSGFFSPRHPEDAKQVVDRLQSDGEPFLVLADFAAYAQAQDQVDALYADSDQWSSQSSDQLPEHGLLFERPQYPRVRGSNLGRQAGDIRCNRIDRAGDHRLRSPFIRRGQTRADIREAWRACGFAPAPVLPFGRRTPNASAS